MSAGAQNFKYGEISYDDLLFKKSSLDSTANAVVLKEYGFANMLKDQITGELSVVFEYHVRIKILNKDGYKHGSIAIPLRSFNSNSFEVIDKLKGVTSSYTNGEVIKTDLNPKDVVVEKLSKYKTVTKFNLPNLIDGSIIEYSYILYSPDIFNFRQWVFQSDIPKLESKYIASLPRLYKYAVSIQGSLQINAPEAKVIANCVSVNGRPVSCLQLTYEMKDIPPFVEDEYLSAASNFRSSVNFELSEYVVPNRTQRSIENTWKDFDRDLVKDKSFGLQMKETDLFKSHIPGVIPGASNHLDKARLIYAYIKKSIKSNGSREIYSNSSIKKAMELHSGNVGDINLALIAALTSAGLDAEAVILSTREHGLVHDVYPVSSDFNYVLAKVNVDGKSYLLDASEPLLPFGLIPFQCLNGKGRVIGLTKPSYWYDLQANQKESTTYTLSGAIGQDGKVKGSLTVHSLGYAALDARKKITSAVSAADYLKEINEHHPNINLSSHRVKNLDSLDLPLVETFDVAIDNFEHLYFNGLHKNPFISDKRTYPIDAGVAKDQNWLLSIKLPDNYVPESLPADVLIHLPNDGGKYTAKHSFQDHILSANAGLQMDKIIYNPEDYMAVKAFFEKVILSQKTNFAFKKTN